jgi:hypothetical protein
MQIISSSDRCLCHFPTCPNLRGGRNSQLLQQQQQQLVKAQKDDVESDLDNFFKTLFFLARSDFQGVSVSRTAR